MSQFSKHRALTALAVICALIVPLTGCATVERISSKAYSKLKQFLPKTRSVSKRDTSPKDMDFARQQYHLGRYSVAEFYLKKIMVKHPDHPQAIRLLPWVYFYQKKYDKALTSFQRARTHQRKNPEPLIGMAWSYFSMKYYDLAMDTFIKAEELTEDSYHIHKGKGFTNLILSREDEALEEFRKIYTPDQIQEAMAFWENSQDETYGVIIDTIPVKPDSFSLFTLPIEHPRYRSVLLSVSGWEPQELDNAWEFYRKKSYNKALKAFKSLPRRQEVSLDALNGLAWTYMQSKQVRKAGEIFKGILRTYPNFIGALKGLQEVNRIKTREAAYADYYIEQGKEAIARKRLEALKKKYPDWSHPFAQLGRLELVEKKYGAARKYFKKAQKLDPESRLAEQGMDEIQKVFEPVLYEADQVLKNGDYKKSARLYAEYIEENPSARARSIAHATNGLGWSQYRKRRYQLAAEKFLMAGKHNEFAVDSAKGLGLSYYEMGKFKNAAEALKAAYDVNPNDHEIAYKLDWSILRGWESQQAADYFERSLQHYPLRASLYMGRGWIHYKENQPDLAVEYFLKTISLDPDFALSEEFKKMLTKERYGWQVYNRLGWAYYQNENYNKSLEMFQTSLRTQPNKSEARKGMGYNLFKLGRYKLAVKFLDQCLRINPDPNPIMETITDQEAVVSFELETTARTKLGRIYNLLDKPREAVVHFQQELELRPQQADALDGLGWAYLKLNRLAESRTSFTAALQRQPLNPKSHKGLVEVKLRLASEKLESNPPASAPPVVQPQDLALADPGRWLP